MSRRLLLALIGRGSIGLIIAAIVCGCVFALVASLVMNWASGKSALWNIGFAVALMVVAAGVLLLAVVIVMERIPR